MIYIFYHIKQHFWNFSDGLPYTNNGCWYCCWMFPFFSMFINIDTHMMMQKLILKNTCSLPLIDLDILNLFVHLLIMLIIMYTCTFCTNFFVVKDTYILIFLLWWILHIIARIFKEYYNNTLNSTSEPMYGIYIYIVFNHCFWNNMFF